MPTASLAAARDSTASTGRSPPAGGGRHAGARRLRAQLERAALVVRGRPAPRGIRR